jgi:prepilin-type processing-associated H-X9-DG protein/prepilin-type N-terminal cleavage/methylation domain-containing protein
VHVSATRRAFTLIEILVVIGIIALLIAILLPSLHKARQQAQQVECQSNLRQWGIGIVNYVTQHRGILPYKGPDGTSGNQFNPQNGVMGYNDPNLWFNAIPPLVGVPSYFDLLLKDSQNPSKTPAPQFGDHSIFICPSSLPPATLNGHDAIDPANSNYYDLYGIDSTNTIKTGTGLRPQQYFRFDLCYVWNSKMASPIVPDPRYPSSDVASLKMTMLRPSSQVPLMVEKICNCGEYKTDRDVQRWCSTSPGSTVYGPGSADHPGEITSIGFNNNVQQAKADWTRFAARHNGGGNILFADGHVSWFKWSEVQYSPAEIAGGWTQNSDQNHNPAGIIWCPLGPTH